VPGTFAGTQFGAAEVHNIGRQVAIRLGTVEREAVLSGKPLSHFAQLHFDRCSLKNGCIQGAGSAMLDDQALLLHRTVFIVLQVTFVIDTNVFQQPWS
jgi:hypothetical protein